MTIEEELEKAKAEKEYCEREYAKVVKKELQAKHRVSNYENKLKEEKRKKRTHRLITRGAILEKFIPNAECYSDEQITWLLKLLFSKLQGGVESVHFPSDEFLSGKKLF